LKIRNLRFKSWRPRFSAGGNLFIRRAAGSEPVVYPVEEKYK
jgi:hypothetical protein